MTPFPMVSVIIPTLNESSRISATLGDLRRVRGDFEVLVADGGSTDGTAEIVEAIRLSYRRSLRLLRSPRNRALQLNQAADRARGGTLLFLHADAILAPEAIEALEAAMAADGSLAGGNFALCFQGHSLWSRFFTWVERWRRRCGIYYGDSGLFVRRGVFERLDGFRPMPIMDDYEFVRRLEKFGPTTCLAPLILVSDRRWRIAGVWRTMWTWFWVQLCYSLGVPATSLARWYKPVRDMEAAGRVPACTSSRASSETHACRQGRQGTANSHQPILRSCSRNVKLHLVLASAFSTGYQSMAGLAIGLSKFAVRCIVFCGLPPKHHNDR